MRHHIVNLTPRKLLREILTLSIVVGVVTSGMSASTRSYGKRIAQGGMITSLRLLAVPEMFDGKRLFVDGFVAASSDRCYLFASEADARRFRSTSAIAISLDPENPLPRPAAKILNGRWVALEGVFRRIQDNEEAGIGGGYLEKVSFITFLDSSTKSEEKPK